jgi:heme/copper-type cytochrome/quinol oxidase subunit 1
MATATVPRRSALGEALAGARHAAENPHGILGWLATVDHKRIGVLYGVTAFLLFLVGGLEALLLQLLDVPGRRHRPQRQLLHA